MAKLAHALAAPRRAMLPTQNPTELGETFDTLDVIRRSANLISPAARALKLFETRPRRF
jgi:hypothetical protein